MGVMTETAHTFRAGDGSLRHRVREYLSAAQAHERARRSAGFADDASWSDRLGSAEDIAVAEQILQRSLARNAAAISDADIRTALAEGLLSDEQEREFAQVKTQMAFAEHSKPSRQSQSDTPRQKR